MPKTLKQGDAVTFGEKYRDTVLGIEGVATAHTSYLTGCDHVCLEWVKEQEIKHQWFDIVRLEHVASEAAAVPSSRNSGGPAAHPPGRGAPR